MYVDSAGMRVEHWKIDEQAARFAALGEDLHQHVTRAETQPLLLGTSPPAQWFAAKLATLAGPDGTPRALRDWADGLAQLSTDERATANLYRTTDDIHAVTFNRVHPAVHLPVPGNSQHRMPAEQHP